MSQRGRRQSPAFCPGATRYDRELLPRSTDETSVPLRFADHQARRDILIGPLVGVRRERSASRRWASWAILYGNSDLGYNCVIWLISLADVEIIDNVLLTDEAAQALADEIDVVRGVVHIEGN